MEGRSLRSEIRRTRGELNIYKELMNEKNTSRQPSPLPDGRGMGVGLARLDKWLWAARIFKTRTLAAAACKRGQVTVGGVQMKPSRTVKVGDIIDVRKPPITYSFRILQAIEKRVGAKLIPQILENVTTPDQYELLEMNRISGFVNRARGTGRPTKKERRAIDDFSAQAADIPIFIGDFDFGDDDEEED